MLKISSNHRVAWYGLTIFLSSAFLLVFEIAAGRLLAPYIGVSLYTWTSIIGVILAGLSLGNWIGGAWADRGGDEKAAGVTLALGAGAGFLILVLLKLIAPLVQESALDLLTASFIYVSLLFFLPAMLLGIITPLLTTLALALDRRTGKIVGRMHALAALGSIVGTFVTGYWLVQYFGTRMVIVGTAAALLLLAIPFLVSARTRIVVALALFTVLSVGISMLTNAVENPCQRESNYYCIRVVDQPGVVPYGEARAMVLDHLMHGINHSSEDWMLLAPYTHLMDELILHHVGADANSGLRFFFAGGGAFSQPRATRALYKDVQVTIAELDPVVTEVAEHDLFFKRRGMTVKHQDARLLLQQAQPASYDVIVGDVFHDVAIPYHLLTREYSHLIKSRLTARGIYTLNIVDIWPDGQLVKSVVKTLAADFRYVDVWLEEIPAQPTRMTYVLSASNKAAMPDTIVARRGFQRHWRRVTAQMLASGTPMASLPVLTDDYVPVERLISPLLLTGLGN